MLKVEAIVRIGALKKVLTKLLEIDYPGLTVYEVQGHGRQPREDVEHQEAPVPHGVLHVVGEHPEHPHIEH